MENTYLQYGYWFASETAKVAFVDIEIVAPFVDEPLVIVFKVRLQVRVTPSCIAKIHGVKKVELC